MTRSLKDVLERSGSINETMEKSQNLLAGSERYKNMSKDLNKESFWKNYGIYLIIVLGLILFLYFYFNY